MKLTFAIAFVALIPWVSLAQNSPSAGAAERVAPAPREPGAAVPVSVPVPVVRVPAGPTGAAAAGAVTPRGEARAAEGRPGGSELGSGLGGGLSTQLGWSSTGVELREPTVTTLKTNRSVELGGMLPRVARPEKKGFGGFLAGFANLFNPFAPTAKGVESRGAHWYDGGIQTAPLPRGLRDERFHEPQTAVFSTEFGRGRGADEPAEPPAPKLAPAVLEQP